MKKLNESYYFFSSLFTCFCVCHHLLLFLNYPSFHWFFPIAYGNESYFALSVSHIKCFILFPLNNTFIIKIYCLQNMFSIFISSWINRIIYQTAHKLHSTFKRAISYYANDVKYCENCHHLPWCIFTFLLEICIFSRCRN